MVHYRGCFKNLVNTKTGNFNIARFLVAIASMIIHWQCPCQLRGIKKKTIFQKKGVKKRRFTLTYRGQYSIIPLSIKGENIMNHYLGQVVQTINNTLNKGHYFVITKLDRDNEMYEIEDGCNTFFAWDECLTNVNTSEFLADIQAGKITSELVIKSWLKNQNQYS